MPTSAILYRSTESPSFSTRGLLRLTEEAKVSNARQGITGLLVHGQLTFLPNVPGGFVQWIEGETERVQALYETIRSDERHIDVETIAEGLVQDLAGTRRLFPFWSMRMESLADLPATLPGFLRYAEAKQVRWVQAA